MFGNRRRRGLNIKPALIQGIVLAGCWRASRTRSHEKIKATFYPAEGTLDHFANRKKQAKIKKTQEHPANKRILEPRANHRHTVIYNQTEKNIVTWSQTKKTL